MTTPRHRHHALNHLEAVEAYAENLREEYRKPRPDLDEVRYLNAAIGRGLKLAEVHAALHTGTQLERIADRLADDDVLDFILGDRPRFTNGHPRAATLTEQAGQ